jgi:O-antigen/teichoic acid export membrane protein
MAWSVVARVGRMVLGMASSVIVVRSLGAHDYGVLSLVRNLMWFAMILALGGMGQTLLRFLPALRVENNAGGAATLVRRAAGVCLVLWVGLGSLVFAVRGVIERVFSYEGLAVFLAAAVALMIFELFFTLLSRVLESVYDTQLLSFAVLLTHVVYIAGLIVSLTQSGGVPGVIVAAATGNAAGLAVVWFRVRKRIFAGVRPQPSPEYGGVRMARYAIPFVAVGLLNMIVWRQSETIFLAHFRTAQETGFFDLAYKLPQMLLEFIPGAVWPLVLAGFSETYARNADNIRIAIDRYYRMLFLLCAPICVVGIVLGGRLVPIVYGETMLPAALPAQIFFAVFTVSFLGTPLSMSLYVLEKPHVNLIVYLCMAVVNVGLDLLLIPRYGLAGAMIPVAVVTVAAPFVYMALIRRYVSGVRIPFVFIGRCFLATVPVVALVPLLRFVSGPLELAAACLAAAILILAGFRLVRVIGPLEMEAIGAFPIPLVNRILRFIAR